MRKDSGFEHIPTFLKLKSFLNMSDILSTPGRLYIYIYHVSPYFFGEPKETVIYQSQIFAFG